MIDDPLQNILHAAHMVLYARTQQRPGNWLAAIGEMDWLTEIHRTMEQVLNDLMKPDFIITQRVSPDGLISIVLPTHTGALTWMFAHVEAAERRQMSAHLGDARLTQFKSDAAVENLTFSEPTSSPQPAGGGRS